MASPGRSVAGVGRRSTFGVCAAGGPQTFDVSVLEDIAVEFSGDFIHYNLTTNTIITTVPATIDLGPHYTTAMLKAWGNRGDNVVPSFLRFKVFDGTIDPPNDDASDFTDHPVITGDVFTWNGLQSIYNGGTAIDPVVDTGVAVELHGFVICSIDSGGDVVYAADGVFYFNPTVDTTNPPFDKTATEEQIMFYATGMGGLSIQTSRESPQRDAHFVVLHMIATFSV